jgi:aminopeptidase-like protein
MTSLPTSAGDRMRDLLVELWPLHRTLSCAGTDEALEMVGAYIGDDRYKTHEFAPHSDALTWRVPERFEVSEAWLEIAGERVADFAENPLHLLSYSLPQRIDGRLADIRDHLWTRPDRPNAIPWEFKYYERSWGFCVRHADLERFDDDAPVKGVIDTSFEDEPLRLAEFYLPGTSDQDVLFMTNVCHPMQVNDSLAGLVVGAELARRLADLPQQRLGFRLLVVPETIGTICWFDRFPEAVKKIKHAWFCEMVGHDNSFILQHSRQGSDALIDRAFLTVLADHEAHGRSRTGSFREVVASDELVSNGPGFDIPTPSLTRWPYPEYHTSDDNPNIVRAENLEEALDVCAGVVEALEANYVPSRTFKGPVMLSRYDLWVDWREDRALNLKTEKLMLMLEGDKSVIDIAYELELPLSTVVQYLDRFAEAGLIERNETRKGK